MKKILVIYTAFSPENAIGSIRNTKLVKYLVQAKYKLTVISPELGPGVKIDATLAATELQEIRHIVIPYSKFFTKYFLAKRNEFKAENTELKFKKNPSKIRENQINGLMYRAIKEIYTLIRNQDWKIQVQKYIRNHNEIKGFEIVLTSYPSLSSHLLGEFVIREKIADKWIADFRDLIAYHSLNSKITYWINRIYQKRFCLKANAVTSVTERLIDKLSEETLDKSKFYYLPNGFDEDDINAIKKISKNSNGNYDNKFYLAYVGNLYNGKRDLSLIFKSLKRLIDTEQVNIDEVQFLYAGKDFPILFEQASRYGTENLLNNLGYVSREISLQVQAQSNLVIVSTWNTEEEQGLVTGKVYECFLLRKPILAIINGTQPNSELGKMVEKAGLGFVYDTMLADRDSEDQLKDFIKGIYDSAVKGEKFHLDLNNEYIEQFNYKNITKKLIEIINEI